LRGSSESDQLEKKSQLPVDPVRLVVSTDKRALRVRGSLILEFLVTIPLILGGVLSYLLFSARGGRHNRHAPYLELIQVPLDRRFDVRKELPNLGFGYDCANARLASLSIPSDWMRVS
jgi:hypothetical protein